MRPLSGWTVGGSPQLAQFLASELRHATETAIGAPLFAGREFEARAAKWIALELIRRYEGVAQAQRFPVPDPHQM